MSYLEKKLSDGIDVKQIGCSQKEAGLAVLSLPLPRGCKAEDCVLGDGSGSSLGLGCWPGEASGSHRRALLFADISESGSAPKILKVYKKTERPAAGPGQHKASASMPLLRRGPDDNFVWEQHMLKLCWNNLSVEFAMGLRTRGKIHWWEACRLVTLEEVFGCMVVEMGGAIPVHEYDSALMASCPGYSNPYLHKHNWINGHIYARLHYNGVFEIFAHHINSKFVDDGGSFDDVVPVIGIREEGKVPPKFKEASEWAGDRDILRLKNAQLDLSEANHLATDLKPGMLNVEDGFLVWQPYSAVELYGGIYGNEKFKDPYIFRPGDKHFPRGMSRTIRFRASLNPERSPRAVRYIAPAWWYGACEEFSGEPYLPVSNALDGIMIHYANFGVETMHKGGFEDGSIPRHIGRVDGGDRPEPGWEGEVPYGLLLYAWRKGDGKAYDAAMRSSWYFTDVCIDHAVKQVRMHGQPPNNFSLPMARVLCSIGAWLETGDPYLINTAMAVIETAHWTELNSWPRMCVGRDACYLRSAVMLYRYLGSERYLEIAREGIGHVIESQNNDGSFGDQGGGARLHQWAGYIVKPWMAFMAIGGLLDYLELFPGEDKVIKAVRKLADWLMRERFINKNGETGWCSQHSYNGRRDFKSPSSGRIIKLKSPENQLWHIEYMARFFMFCTKEFKDSKYFNAWLESCSWRYGKNPNETIYGSVYDNSTLGDHAVAQSLQFIPRLQAWLWQAKATKDGVVAEPVWAGENTPEESLIMAPGGDVLVRWIDGHIKSDCLKCTFTPKILPGTEDDRSMKNTLAG